MFYSYWERMAIIAKQENKSLAIHFKIDVKSLKTR
ncbi:hypothetical protein B14911_09777 [Bacillus sp. NRRL B-14911]|uniref:Uncharacterized protein n=1 Tax=Bacillus infantis NRRL B-14911 TaxID=1367477 RepID=U5LBB1_9BACI|nr:hypothetical protein N288_10535 [Bacillus infantis NRRL B-14911]EAR65854.1 hypothetical protein B14911_09777 [Bacillus sp. NRRL B-14911]